MAGAIKFKDRDLTAYYECPKCHSRDLRGPIDTAPTAVGHLTRSWFCRVCWWDTSLKLRDRAFAKASGDATKA